MDTIKSFEQMTAYLADNKRRIRYAMVCADDDSTLHAAEQALAEGFAHIIFVGDCQKARSCKALQVYREHIEYAETTTADPAEAAQLAVRLVHEGRAEVVMKGLLNTDVLLRAVLDKEKGLLPQGKVLTHITLAQMPGLDRLLFFTDAAVIPYPTHEQRMAQVEYITLLCRSFGIGQPRISLIHCSEKPSEKFPHTMGYAEICTAAKEGKWGEAIVDGPLDLRTSIDPVALKKKGIHSALEGKADALIFPDIEAGNTFYKTITFLAHADVAGILQGTLCPVVLSSRGDGTQDKYHSMALAAMSSKQAMSDDAKN